MEKHISSSTFFDERSQPPRVVTGNFFDLISTLAEPRGGIFSAASENAGTLGVEEDLSVVMGPALVGVPQQSLRLLVIARRATRTSKRREYKTARSERVEQESQQPSPRIRGLGRSKTKTGTMNE